MAAMKRILLLLAVFGYCSTSSLARWFIPPLDELVQHSDIIIIGTLERVSEYTQNGVDYGEGAILIEEVLWGMENPGGLLSLKWQNNSGVVCPRVEHRGKGGTKGIWLLTVEQDGTVRADNPGRFVALDERPKVEKCIAKSTVSLRSFRYWYSPEEPVKLSLVFRNPTQDFMMFPGVEYRDGQLLVAPGVVLEVYEGYGKDAEITNPLPGKVKVSKTLAPIMIGPRQEFRLILDLRALFPITDDENYSLRLRVKGFGRADLRIYARQGSAQTIIGSNRERVVHARPPLSKLHLLMPSMIAILVSSIFVYRHAREIVKPAGSANSS